MMFPAIKNRVRKKRWPALPGALLLILCLMATGTSAGSTSGDSFRADPGRVNPHREIACTECHRKVPEKGSSTWADIAKGLVREPVALCRGCHPESEAHHHPVNRKPERALPEGLPAGVSGDVVCSTCHDVHLTGGQESLLRGFDTGRYRVRMDMCLDCHGKGFAEVNPHRMEEENRRCYTCHSTTPTAADISTTVTFREEIGRICDFCHNVREKSHPLNVDPMRALPENLPRDSKGRMNCGTCHDPHGAGETIHFLRRRYVDFLESGRYMNPHGQSDYRSCQGCHLEVSTDKKEMRRRLRYGGDDLQICLSCHGAMESCHPILVKPGGRMKQGKGLPLSPEGKITCMTCHDPMPAGGHGVATRGREPGEPINALCFRCHDREELMGRNPHFSMSDRSSCRFCHDTMTDPTNEEAARVSFISNTRLICLRCHPQEAHPMGVNHMVVPKMEIPEPFRLDMKGKITCTTCHNPHIEARKSGEKEGRSHRFVVDAGTSSLCGMCHKR